jgi:hypothetical protein
MAGMRLRALAVSALLALVGCDGSSDALDAGRSDSGRRRRDAGTDAGPAPRVDLCDPSEPTEPFPAPDAWGANRGPGGPRVTFTPEQIYETCTYLDGGELDTTDHHNLVTMFDGYLLMPWAPEWGGGGLTFWDFADPCRPVVIGTGFSPTMRETHAIGFSTFQGRWAVVDQVGALLQPGRTGIQIWDIADPTAPTAVADLELPEVSYPDAYARVTLSVFWQVPYIYTGSSDLGIHIVDASDPRRPRYVGNYRFDPILRVGQVQAIGNLLIATAAEGPGTALLDISDPENPVPIAGGEFLAADRTGTPREAYFTNFVGGFLYYARKSAGGGLIVYDVRDPSRPTFAGDIASNGNGGYVFVHEGLAFVGESSFAAIYDARDLTNITEVTRLDLVGDLDTITPIGNVAVLSVDDEAIPDQGSSVVPYQAEPDARPPVVAWTWPTDGATELRTTSRLGVAFDEFVDARSAFEGSVRLYRAGMDPDAGRVATIVSAQESIVNVHPRCPLEPDTEYVLEVMAGGVIDFNGNAVAETTRVTFRTGPE